jgi:uncharacterized protein (TIGR03437 family)
LLGLCLSAQTSTFAWKNVNIQGMGYVTAAVSFAEDVPDMVAGILRVDAQVPAGVQPGPAVSVVINVGGVASQAGVTLAVK